MRGSRMQIRFYMEGRFSADELARFADFLAGNADISYQVKKLRGEIADPYELVSISRVGSSEDLFEVRVDTPIIADPLPYVLSLAFGNMIRPQQVRSVTLQDLIMPAAIAKKLGGPRFGSAQLRAHLGIMDRPLISVPLAAEGAAVEDSITIATQLIEAHVSLIPDSPVRFYTEFWQVEKYLAGVASYLDSKGKGKRAICFIVVNRLFTNALKFAKKLSRLSADLGILIGIRIDPWIFGLANIQELAELGLPILCFSQMSRMIGSSAVALVSLLRYAGADLISVGTGKDVTYDRDTDIMDSINRMRRKTNLSSEPSMPFFIEPAEPLVTGGLTPQDAYRFTQIYGKDMVFHMARPIAQPLSPRENVEAFLLAIEAALRGVAFEKFLEEEDSADVLRKYINASKRQLP